VLTGCTALLEVLFELTCAGGGG